MTAGPNQSQLPTRPCKPTAKTQLPNHVSRPAHPPRLTSPLTIAMSLPSRRPAAFLPAAPLSLRRPRLHISPLCRPTPSSTTPRLRALSFPHMSSAAHELRRRISSVQAAEKIVSALRIVAAARIRASSAAALRTRPFAEELQHVLASLVAEILARDIDVHAVAHATPPHSLADTHGALLADPIVQKALLDRIYLTLLSDEEEKERVRRRKGRRTDITIITVLTADKGFCGSYNKGIITRAARRIRELNDVGNEVELVVVGKTAKIFFDRHYPHVPVRFYCPMGKSTDAEVTATTLSHTLLSEFIAGGVDRIEVIYTRFVSLLANAPSARTLLPLTPTGLEAVGDELFQLTLTTKNGRLTTKRSPIGNGIHGHGHARGVPPRLEKSFYSITDDEAIRLLNSMLPMYVTSQLIRIVREAIASEQASRLAAMSAATENAREIVSSLQTQYQKERQAKITTEIIEVVANANA